MNIYFIFNVKNNTIKIGKSKYINKRLITLQTGNSETLYLYGSIINTHFTLETGLHNIFKKEHNNLEWYNYSGKLKRFLEILFKNNYIFDCEKNNLPDFLNENNFYL